MAATGGGFESGLKKGGDGQWHYAFKQAGVVHKGSTHCTSRGTAAEWLRAFRTRLARAEVGIAPPRTGAADTTPTVREVAERFYAGHVQAKNKPQTQAYQRWALDKYVIPQLGDLRITELTRQRTFAFLDGLAQTPVTANRVRALLSKMWNWSEARDESEGTPMAEMPNPTRGWERHAEDPRERRLSEAEIRALGEAYRLAPSPLNGALIFILLTGCREGAVLALTPELRVLADGLLRFPAGLPGLKGCRRIYVPQVAAALLDQATLPVLKRSLWRNWSALRAAAKIDDVSIHDLRRTFASVAVDQGHDPDVVDALQSHSVGRIRGTYQVRADPAIAKVAAEVADHIASLLGLAPPKSRRAQSGSRRVPAAKSKITKTRATTHPAA